MKKLCVFLASALLVLITEISFAQNFSFSQLNNEFELDKEAKVDLLQGSNFKTFKVSGGYFVYFSRYKYYLNSNGRSDQIPFYILFDSNKKFVSMGEILCKDFDLKGNVSEVTRIKDKIYVLFNSVPTEGRMQLWAGELNTTSGNVKGTPFKVLDQNTSGGFMGSGFVLTQNSQKPYVYSLSVVKDKIEILYGVLNDNLTMSTPTKIYYVPSGNLPEISVTSMEIDESGNAHLIMKEGTGSSKESEYVNYVYSYYLFYKADTKRTLISKVGGKTAYDKMPASIGFDNIGNTYICINKEQASPTFNDNEIFWLYKYGKDGKLIKSTNIILNELERKALVGNSSSNYYRPDKNSEITTNIKLSNPEFHITGDGGLGGFLFDSYRSISGGYETHDSFLWLVFNTNTLECSKIPFGRYFSSFNSDLEKVTVFPDKSSLSLVYFNSEKNYTEDMQLVPLKKMAYSINLDKKAHIYKCTVNSSLSASYTNLWDYDPTTLFKLHPIKTEEGNYIFLENIKKSVGTFNLIQMKVK
ncbi:MAG: hypothetical protein K2Q22_07965 [Cytophagales bacterium]|nr:hypothetical protein [Cytophagales bacterium]